MSFGITEEPEKGWGGWDNNIYYQPEKCGVEILGMIEKEANYDFDMVIFLKYDGRYFVVHDSGCSCPTPFEDIHSESDLTEVRTAKEARAFILSNDPGYDGGYPDADVLTLMRKVREELDN